MNKKSLFFLICALILSVVSYNMGYDKAKELTSQEYQSKIMSMENPKGDGLHFTLSLR